MANRNGQLACRFGTITLYVRERPSLSYRLAAIAMRSSAAPSTNDSRVKSPKLVRLTLKRIANLRGEGWYSADLHIHRPLSQIDLLMQAEDLGFAPVIIWWNPATIASKTRAHKRARTSAKVARFCFTGCKRRSTSPSQPGKRRRRWGTSSKPENKPPASGLISRNRFGGMCRCN